MSGCGYGNGRTNAVREGYPLAMVYSPAQEWRELLEAAYGKKGLYEKRLEKQSNATFIITGTDIKKLQAKG
ncbi:MAG: hypothetical protein IJ480_12335, partial [Clostridia bacterium]|nr:hypothetical protein [Clostridia bacterium]